MSGFRRYTQARYGAGEARLELSEPWPGYDVSTVSLPCSVVTAARDCHWSCFVDVCSDWSRQCAGFSSRFMGRAAT